MANMSWYIEKVLCDTHAAYVVLGAVPTPFKNVMSKPPMKGLPGANAML
jgi:hypothetical protein